MILPGCTVDQDIIQIGPRKRVQLPYHFIHLWKVDGAEIKPIGIVRNWYFPKGVTNAVLSLLTYSIGCEIQRGYEG